MGKRSRAVRVRKIKGTYLTFYKKAWESISSDPSQLRRPNDTEEIEIDDSLRCRQRLLPTSKRPSVVAGQCVSPDLWWQGNYRTFGCARCTEQDVCPVFRAEFSKAALQRGAVITQNNAEWIHQAAKYWGIKIKELGRVDAAIREDRLEDAVDIIKGLSVDDFE